MPFTFKCPQCQKALSANEANVGQKVRCPGCSTVFPVPSPPAAPAVAPPPRPAVPRPAAQPKPASRPAPPPEPEEQPEGDPFNFAAPPRAASSGGRAQREYDWTRVDDTADRPPLEPEWREVGRGLDMVRLGVNLFLGAYSVALVANLVILMILVSRSPGMVPLYWLLQGVAFLLWLSGFIIVGVGEFRCIVIPESSGVKGLALAAAICSVIPVANIVGWILFLVVLRSMAVYLRDRRLASQILTFLICMAVSPVVLCLCGAGLGVVIGESRNAELELLFPILIQGAFAVLFLSLSLWFGGLVQAVRGKISRSRIADPEEVEDVEDE
jgi:hypothetical protein